MKYEIIKGSEKDFEGAPEGTLYVLHCTGSNYHSVDMMRTLCGLDLCDSDHQYIIAERRPITEPAWNGEGVPCVGQKVMTKSGEGIIDYVGSGVIVYSNNDGQWSIRCDSLDYSLSAIRSPEDMARDEFVKALVDFDNHRQTFGVDKLYGEIYDAIAAGKIPGITKTPTVSELMRVTENATREDCEAIVKMLSGK